MFTAMLEENQKNPGKYNLSTVTKGIAAGSIVPEFLMRRINEEMGLPDLTICYGQTETSPVSF